MTLGCGRERPAPAADAAADRDASPGRPDPCPCRGTRNSTALLPFDCLYGVEENVATPATLADYDAAGLCANGGSVARAMGCGKIAIRDSVILAGSAPTFDAKSKALVGVYAFSD